MAVTGFRLDGVTGPATAAGDINDDGFDDLVIGAPGGDPNGQLSGETYVVYGGPFSTEPSGQLIQEVAQAATTTISGGNGKDELFGGDGNDVIDPGAGKDIMTGGLGSDIFVFDLDGARDEVTDFEDGIDHIGLNGGIVFDDLIIENSAKGGVAINFNGNPEMLLQNVADASQITADDFLVENGEGFQNVANASQVIAEQLVDETAQVTEATVVEEAPSEEATDTTVDEVTVEEVVAQATEAAQAVTDDFFVAA